MAHKNTKNTSCSLNWEVVLKITSSAVITCNEVWHNMVGCCEVNNKTLWKSMCEQVDTCRDICLKCNKIGFIHKTELKTKLTKIQRPTVPKLQPMTHTVADISPLNMPECFHHDPLFLGNLVKMQKESCCVKESN